MERLHFQDKIPLKSGGYCTIQGHLGCGGMADIYAIEGHKVLKWFKPECDDMIRKNIEALVAVKPPYPNLTWPLQMTENYQNSFGYVMSRIPSGYVSLAHYIYDDRYYLNFEEMLQIGYGIAASFQAIHKHQYVYQDINPNGILIHKAKQRVIICDLDNCNQKGQIFVSGTPMYMAPEILTGQSQVNLYTDYYSLSVILFQLFFINHPLEGKKTWSKPLDEDSELEYFGRHPIFVLDPHDSTNGLCAYTDALEKRWKYYPDILKNAFMQAFTIGLQHPKQRFSDTMWMDVIRQSYALLVKKKINGSIRQGFLPITSPHYRKLNIKGQKILMSEYKKFYGYMFDYEDLFTSLLFECSENQEIICLCENLYYNHHLMKKGEKQVLHVHDLITYHGIEGIVE